MNKALFDDGLSPGRESDKRGPGLGDGRVVLNDGLVEYFVAFRRKHKKIVVTPPHGMGKWKVEMPNKRASWYLTGAAVREALEKRFPPDLECTHADGHDPQTFHHGNVTIVVCRNCGNEVSPDDNLRPRAVRPLPVCAEVPPSTPAGWQARLTGLGSSSGR